MFRSLCRLGCSEIFRDGDFALQFIALLISEGRLGEELLRDLHLLGAMLNLGLLYQGLRLWESIFCYSFLFGYFASLRLALRATIILLSYLQQNRIVPKFTHGFLLHGSQLLNSSVLAVTLRFFLLLRRVKEHRDALTQLLPNFLIINLEVVGSLLRAAKRRLKCIHIVNF